MAMFAEMTRNKTVLDSVRSNLGEFIQAAIMRIAEQSKRDKLLPLLNLEDRELSDMGITRDDVTSALKLPADQNAGKFLELVRKRK